MAGREVTRGGQKGHMVEVSAYKKFVKSEYPGTDPRTRAAHKEKR